MVTSVHEPPSDSLTLPDDVRAEAAYLRAQGRPWDEAAKAVGWDAAKLRSAARRDPRFEAELADARLEAQKDAEAQLIASLRQLAASQDPEVVMKAVTLLSRHITAKRREETRLAVEQSRALARLAHTEAPKAKGEPREPAKPAEAPVAVLPAGDRRADTPQLICNKDARVGGKPAHRPGPPADAAGTRGDSRSPEPPKPRVAPEG